MDQIEGQLNNRHVEGSGEIPDVAGAAGTVVPLPPTKVSTQADFKEISQRLDKLQNIVLQSLQRQENPRGKDRVFRLSDVDTDDSYLSDDSEDSHQRRRRCKGKSKFEQKRFSPEGEAISSFEVLMLTTANTMIYMMERDLDVSTLVHHFKFLVTKAVAAHYKPEAFVNYDNAVCQCVARDGLPAFSDVSQEELVLQFQER